MRIVLRLLWQQIRTNRRLTRNLRGANNTNEALLRIAEGWRSRAEALYLLADPDKRDGVLETITSIEALEESA